MTLTYVSTRCVACDMAASVRIADSTAAAIVREQAQLERSIRQVTQCQHELYFSHRTTDEALPV